MKKSLLIFIICIMVLCGCSKKEKLTCTQELENDTKDVKIESKTVIKFTDGYATEFISNQVLTFKDEESAKKYIDEQDTDYTYKIDGSKVTIDYSKKIDKNDKTEENTKNYIKNYLENKNYTCK